MRALLLFPFQLYGFYFFLLPIALARIASEMLWCDESWVEGTELFPMRLAVGSWCSLIMFRGCLMFIVFWVFLSNRSYSFVFSEPIETPCGFSSFIPFLLSSWYSGSQVPPCSYLQEGGKHTKLLAMKRQQPRSIVSTWSYVPTQLQRHLGKVVPFLRVVSPATKQLMYKKGEQMLVDKRQKITQLYLISPVMGNSLMTKAADFFLTKFWKWNLPFG